MPPSPSDPPPDVRQPPAPPVWATTLSAAPAPHDNAPAEPLLPSRLQPIVALIAAAGLAGMAIWFAAAGGFTGGLVAERDTPSHPSDSNPAGYRVDINTARRVELLQLPRIGPALADRIIERRTTVGPYAAIDDLLAVPGIGELTLAEIRPFLQPLPTATPLPPAPAPMTFELVSKYAPAGDQPAAIDALVGGLQSGRPSQVLMGVTGSGKTFTMANVIARVGRPTLVLSHNKTLAAQLYGEFREFFPHNAVHYFVSYYDYYQPEAYIPQRDIYIEKDASINKEIDRLRLAATSALVSRKDVIVVASVSCIYGLGSPEDYKAMVIRLASGMPTSRDDLLEQLISVQYERSDVALDRGRFRVRGDSVDIWPPYDELAVRVEFWGDEIDSIAVIHPVSGEVAAKTDEMYLYPSRHFVMPEDRIKRAVGNIRQELEERLEEFKSHGKLLEAQRLAARTRFDIEMLTEAGFCPGIENYSRPLSGRAPGSTPDTLFNYFPDDFLFFVDESHVTVPQVRGMYAGDRSRKLTLVDHGFRLPSALDNRPLMFDEFEKRLHQTIYVSATPGDWELGKTGGEVIEQIIRPTGLLDPRIEIEPARQQVTHLHAEIDRTVADGHRVLVTTLTKKLAEDLTTYFSERNVRCRWLHSELDAFERVELLRGLREGVFDVLVGVNLLREGLDLPEVALVAILDADKEGFLRSETSLMQTIGRSARNVNARVILYADRITESMDNAVNETKRRRALQEAYNAEHGITPETIRKEIRQGIEAEVASRRMAVEAVGDSRDNDRDLAATLDSLEEEMMAAAAELDFERAAIIRDQIAALRSGKKPAAKGRGRGGRSKNTARIPRPKR